MADLVCGTSTGSEVIAAVNSNTNNKVDKVVGKGLSTNDYSDAEKAKLAAIEAGATGDQTGAEIKIAYESEADTNAYTDTEKAKLGGIEDGATGDQTAAEIKTAYESNLNTNEFSDAEKAKLAGLESSHFKGQYVSLSALQTAYPTASIGDYANVDGGIGSDVTRYAWDSDDSAWVQQLGSSNILSDAEIKTQYESNADTNAYTDTEKAKLAGIASGAEANVIESLLDDTSPQLGGDLDLNGKAIPLALNAQVGTAYTAVLGDAEKIITLNNAAAITMTIPANASVAYPVGTKLNFMQLGAGAVTIAITTDTLNYDSALTAVLNGQYAVATAVKVSATSWVLFGNLAAA